MRGPNQKVKYDVRRVWKCPRCGYERRAPATEVAVRCHCSKEEPLMKLVEQQRHVRAPARPLDVFVTLEDLGSERTEGPNVDSTVDSNGDSPPLEDVSRTLQLLESENAPNSPENADEVAG